MKAKKKMAKHQTTLSCRSYAQKITVIYLAIAQLSMCLSFSLSFFFAINAQFLLFSVSYDALWLHGTAFIT